MTRSCVNVSYPGDGYVDWVGSDWYNVCLVGRTDQWCTPLHSGWAQFDEIFNYTALGSTLRLPAQPVGPAQAFVVGETGSWYDANYPSYKGNWFRNVPAAAKNMLYLRGIQFFDKDVSAKEGPLNNFRVDYPTSDPERLRRLQSTRRRPLVQHGLIVRGPGALRATNYLVSLTQAHESRNETTGFEARKRDSHACPFRLLGSIAPSFSSEPRRTWITLSTRSSLPTAGREGDLSADRRRRPSPSLDPLPGAPRVARRPPRDRPRARVFQRRAAIAGTPSGSPSSRRSPARGGRSPSTRPPVADADRRGHARTPCRLGPARRGE